MSGLNLVIADKDQLYMDNVVEYITTNYRNRFVINSFSDESAFSDYLKRTPRIDVLLMSQEFHNDKLPWEKIIAPIVLSTGLLQKEITNCVIISKYQTGDKLVSNILNLYSEKSKFEVLPQDGAKKTKIIAFYSPCGGSGKTTLAVGTCVQLANNNAKVFYLNLERFSSTVAYFDNNGIQNLSNVFFHIKGKNKNIALKLEASRVKDNITGIDYFPPFENIFDYDDITGEDASELISQMKLLSQYDVIILDLSSDFNNLNKTLMEVCDAAFITLPYDSIAIPKIKFLIKGFEILNKRKSTDLFYKSEIILNKCTSSILAELENLTFGEKPVFSKVPFAKGLDAGMGMSVLADKGNPIGDAINQMVNKIFM